jgi:hypothetical protein
MIGDAEYLKTMSGYSQKASVAKWCKKNGIRYFRNADGWPVTTAAALDRALLPGVEAGPDWSPYAKEKTPAQSPRAKRKVLLRREG